MSEKRIVVDVDNKNRALWFAPIPKTLMGTFRVNGETSGGYNGKVNLVHHEDGSGRGEIEGYRIIVDFDNDGGDYFEYEVIHRLDLPENKYKADMVRKVASRDQSNPLSQREWSDFGHRTNTKSKFHKDELATWLYHIRKEVDAGALVIVEGEDILPPTLNDCRALGDVTLGPESYSLLNKNTDADGKQRFMNQLPALHPTKATVKQGAKS